MQIGVSNPNVPIFLPRVCTLVLFILLEISCRTRWWCLKCVIVYLARDIRPFVMYCVNGKPRSSLLIESTDSMIESTNSMILILINPRRACAERVTVVVLCVCVCVCLSAHAILAVRAIKSVTKDTVVLIVRFAAIL